LSPVDPHRDPAAEPSDRSEAVTGDPTCRDVIERLLDYLEAALDPNTLAAFERHFHDCAPCRAYLRTYDRSRQLVGDLNRDELPDGLNTRLRALLLGRLGADRS